MSENVKEGGKVKESSLIRMSFSIEEELFGELEALIAQAGGGNRSEFIRDMIRKQLTRKLCASNGEVIGTISVLCSLEHAGVESKVTGLLDKTAGIKVLGATRFMVNESCSTTMVTVVGIGRDIRNLVQNIRQIKGVGQAEFVITSPVTDGRQKK